VSSETFTWLHSPVFRATPLDMKAEADLHFLSGINQLICHGWPYTAEGVGFPGWSFYAAGVFDEKNPWWIVMPDLAKYLQRVSALLREGTPANDIALYLPNSDGWAGLGRNFSMSAAMQGRVGGAVHAITDAGYNLDFFDDQLLAMRGKVAGNSLAFGDVHYRVVVLPGVERIPVATMEVLQQFAHNGGIVVATRRLPDRAPGYRAAEGDTQAVRAIVQRIFQGDHAPGIFLAEEAQLGEELAKRLEPDVALAPLASDIGFVHRHTNGAELYFVANTGNSPKRVLATFRVGGLRPEIWSPLSGVIAPVAVAVKSQDETTVGLDLPPYGSTFVVFTSRTLPALPVAPAVAIVPAPFDLGTGWTVKYGPNSPAVAMEQLASWTESEATRNFSGVATYEKTITAAPEWLQTGLKLSFDFGAASAPKAAAAAAASRSQGYRTDLDVPVREAAVLYLNDRRIGSVWAPPYAIDVTGQLQPGENTIRIEVANLAVNYMASIPLPNYNYAGVKQQFGDRFQPQNLDQIAPLPSGLLGPVRLIATGQTAP
jgi:alpha-L-rhamnosidase